MFPCQLVLNPNLENFLSKLTHFLLRTTVISSVILIFSQYLNKKSSPLILRQINL